jgi:hypothetical protein
MKNRLELQRQPEGQAKYIISTVPKVAIFLIVRKPFCHITRTVFKNSMLTKLFGSKQQEMPGA